MSRLFCCLNAVHIELVWRQDKILNLSVHTLHRQGLAIIVKKATRLGHAHGVKLLN